MNSRLAVALAVLSVFTCIDLGGGMTNCSDEKGKSDQYIYMYNQGGTDDGTTGNNEQGSVG